MYNSTKNICFYIISNVVNSWWTEKQSEFHNGNIRGGSFYGHFITVYDIEPMLRWNFKRKSSNVWLRSSCNFALCVNKKRKNGFPVPNTKNLAKSYGVENCHYFNILMLLQKENYRKNHFQITSFFGFFCFLVPHKIGNLSFEIII